MKSFCAFRRESGATQPRRGFRRAAADEGDSLARFLEEADRHPLLDRDEEAELGQCVRRAARERADLEARIAAGLLGAEECSARLRELEREGRAARDRLVRANLRLVVVIAREARCSGLSLCDRVGEGNVGLIHAAERFDPDRGARFHTFAAWHVKQSVYKAIADKRRAIRIPIDLQRRVRNYLHALEELGSALCRSPRREELGAWLGRGGTKVDELARAAEDVRSLEEPLRPGERLTLAEIVAAPASGLALEALFEKECASSLGAALSRLGERERFVIHRRFGGTGTKRPSLAEIGGELDIGAERVRQIQEKALRALSKDERLRELHEVMGGTP